MFLGLEKENIIFLNVLGFKIEEQSLYYCETPFSRLPKSNLRLDSVYGIKKPEPNDSGLPCSGDTTRTCGLRVMSPTSYQLLHPAIYF